MTVDEAKALEDRTMGSTSKLFTAWECPAAGVTVVILDYENDMGELGIHYQRRVRVDSSDGSSTCLIAQSGFSR